VGKKTVSTATRARQYVFLCSRTWMYVCCDMCVVVVWFVCSVRLGSVGGSGRKEKERGDETSFILIRFIYFGFRTNSICSIGWTKEQKNNERSKNDTNDVFEPVRSNTHQHDHIETGTWKHSTITCYRLHITYCSLQLTHFFVLFIPFECMLVPCWSAHPLHVYVPVLHPFACIVSEQMWVYVIARWIWYGYADMK
jgi:hypothetical protein